MKKVDSRRTPTLSSRADLSAWRSISTIKPFRRDLGVVCLTAKRKRFIPTPLPLTQKEKATAFSFCNQGESLASPLLALARRRDTTARLTSALAHHEAGENRCELTLAI